MKIINKTGIRKFLIAMPAIFLVNTGASASDAPVVDRNTITPKLGYFKLNNRNQDLSIDAGSVCVISCSIIQIGLTDDLPVNFDSSSKNVVGIEFERAASSFSYGADLLYIKNSFTLPTQNNIRGDVNVTYLFATLKKYLANQSNFKFYVTGGAGLLEADMSGAISSSTSRAMAAQVATGVRYQMQRFNLVAEYRYVAATLIHYDFGDANTPGQTGNLYGDLNLGGQGLFLGMGVNF